MANFNFNKATIGGRLTADPELKTTTGGTEVVSFTVAVTRRFAPKEGEAQQTDFINVTAWRKTAEMVSKYFRKGSSICVVGSIQTRSWMDNDGKKKYATELVADEVYFVDSKSENDGGSIAGTRVSTSSDNTEPQPEVDAGEPKSDLPF